MAKKMKRADQPNDALRAQLRKLLKACPFHLNNPKDCPLFPLRQLPPKQRQRYIDALSETDLAYLAKYHGVCLRIKQAGHA
jgi:hypothetical protein